MCTPIINNITVAKTLIDGGARLSVLSLETFEKMQLPYDRRKPTMPISGVTEGSTVPIGQVRLPVMFGSRSNYRTELIDFDVAHIGLPYNAILGFLALAKFMAVTHHAYNLVKMPGCNCETITIYCDEKDAVNSMEHAYREAAAAFPVNEDVMEQLGGCERKRQMLSQERARAKRAAHAATLAEDMATATLGEDRLGNLQGAGGSGARTTLKGNSSK
jgi:hypothetical protein